MAEGCCGQRLRLALPRPGRSADARHTRLAAIANRSEFALGSKGPPPDQTNHPIVQ